MKDVALAGGLSSRMHPLMEITSTFERLLYASNMVAEMDANKMTKSRSAQWTAPKEMIR